MRLQQHIDDNLFDIVIMAGIIDECHKIHHLDESVGDSISSMIKGVKDILKKRKPVISKYVEKEKGLAHYFKDLGIGGAQLMYHAFNAYYNKDAKSRERVRELASSVKKEHIMDILLKLDVLSLHLVTGPLHIIDAITGWNFLHYIKNKVEPTEKKVKAALHSLDSLKNDLQGELKSQLIRYTNALRRVFGVEGFQKVAEETVAGDVAAPDMKIGEPVRRHLKTKKSAKDIKKKNLKDK